MLFEMLEVKTFSRKYHFIEVLYRVVQWSQYLFDWGHSLQSIYK
jgi:hypothetical protein